MRILLLVLLMTVSISGQSQTGKKVMSVMDFLNVPAVSDPKISPDGSEILYEFAESDWEANKQVGHIWKVSTEGGNAQQFTFGENGEGQPSWSPDGKWISFITKRSEEDKEQLYIMPTQGGEARPLTQHPTAIGEYQWSPDSKTLYFIAIDSLTKEEKKAKEDKDDVYLYDENYQQKHLWKVNVADGNSTRITEGDYSILHFDLSANGHDMVVHQGPNPLYDFASESEVWVMDTNGQNSVQLTDNDVAEGNARISPDGKQVLFTAFANKDFDFYYNDRLFLISSEGDGSATVPMNDMPFEVTKAEWSDDGKSIFFLANMGAETQLWQYNTTSDKHSQITKGEHTVQGWDYQPKTGQQAVSINTMKNPGDIFLWNKGKPVQLTHHYDYLDQDFYLPKQELISWKGEDGQTVEGLVYYPHDYQEGKQYPLVVQTHGGPASSDKFGFSRSFTRYNPVLTGKGYVVLQPNYRGSTGYGDDFLRDMVGSYFNQSHLDVMAGVDYLVDQGVADPDRLVKMGWSAGGHMTNKLITFTDRFKAASSGAGAVNWVGMYAQSDVRTYRTPWFGGTPWQEDAPIDIYWDNSPLKDISKVTTPTLVIVGESDPRVPLPQSVELFRALRSLDVPTHLLVAPREPHGWQELRHRLFKINMELEWFAKYALDQKYEWEKLEENAD